jgi:hypothetical protein
LFAFAICLDVKILHDKVDVKLALGRDPAFEKKAKSFLDELVWMATILRWGRESLASKYHQ